MSMADAKPSTKDEEDFLNTLLSGLSNSTGHTSRPVTKSPLKHKRRASCTDVLPALKENNGEQDTGLSMLVDGAESWDWGDMEADFMTPQKTKASPKKVRNVLCSMYSHSDSK
jgi:DNA replication ATP-dependent helicase Dna2